MKFSRKKYTFLPICGVCLGLLLLCGYIFDQTVTAFSENAPIKNRKTVVIDAGHGGEDGGAISCTGAIESNINLQISLRLEDLFHLLGVQTVMIRTTDVSIYTQGDNLAQKKLSDLKERVRIVNETDNALLVSIHQNTFSQNRYSGAQVFYAPTAGSDELAKLLQTALVQNLNPGSNRQAQKAPQIYLMKHIEKPGLLIECGFLSNPTEEAMLRTPDYQKKLCIVIASTISTKLHLQDLS